MHARSATPRRLVWLLGAGLVCLLVWLWSWSPESELKPLGMEVDEEVAFAPAESVEPQASAEFDDEDELELDDPRAAAATERAVVAPVGEESALPARLLRALVLDARTNEPLPHYRLSLRQGDRTAEAETDAEGVVELSTAFDAAAFVLQAHDGRRPTDLTTQEVAWDGSPEQQWWRVPCGPTLRVAVHPGDAVPLEQLRVQLQWRNLEEREERSDVLELRPATAGDGSELPWVRFPAITSEEPRMERLIVRSTDGCWRGSSEFRQAYGRSGTVAVELAALAGLDVHVKRAGQNLPQALVTIERMDGRKEDKRSNDDGLAAWSFQPASVVQVRVRHLACVEQRMEATLLAGARTRLDIDLAELPIVGGIAGTLRSDSGTYAQRVTVRLRSETAPELSLWRTSRTEQPYSFANLPAGNYTVEIEENDPYEWSPRKRKVAPGESKADFRVRDAVPKADYSFEPRSRDSGEVLQRFHLVLDTHEGQRSLWARPRQTVLEDWPVDKPFRWRIDADQHAPERGDSAQSQPVASTRDDHLLQVDMRFGWGEWVRVVSSRRSSPIAEAVVLADGVEVGKTDASGWFKLYRRDPPQSLHATFRNLTNSKQPDLRSAKERKWSPIQLVLSPRR